jgi:ribosomal protein S6--L-glutamate ligase
MMRLAILGSTESWYVKDLRRAARGDWRLVPITFCDLHSIVDAKGVEIGSGEVRLNEWDAVLVRTMPPGSLEQVVFRLDALARLEACGVPVTNPAKAIEAAVDKYLSTCRLVDAGLTVPRTAVCQTPEQAMEEFMRLGERVVVKPLFGGEGRGITRLDDPALAERAFKMLAQLGAVLYLQEFVEHEGFDLRLLVIGERVLGMRRRNPLDWRTNVSRGAAAEPLEVTDELADLARRAAAAVGAPLAGVDLLPGRDGTLYAIEVNGVPGWRALARTLQVDVAALVLKLVEDAVVAKRNGIHSLQWTKDCEYVSTENAG